MPSLITRVKSTLFIASQKKSLHALDGAYASLLHGRSLDFDDLRDYEYGDQIRDIDWRATARQGTPLVKRYRATRMHTILFVVDTGRGMRALSRDERPKKDLAILAIGVLGVLALRHGDDFSLVSGDGTHIRRRATGRSEAALEHTLRTIDAETAASAASGDRDGLLSFVARTISRRMIVVVVADEAPLTTETERHLRRLRAQHDLLWITLEDADPVLDHAPGLARADIDTRWAVPSFVQGDPAILHELAAEKHAEQTHRARVLDELEISHTSLATQDAAVPALLRLLNRRAHVRNG